MSQGQYLSLATDQSSNNTHLTRRRVRHVTAIQIRNLTPFPVRDAFASALSQPAEQSQFTSHGHLSDDLDATLSRKRSRRISTNSVTTHRSLRSDDGGEDAVNLGGTGERGRRTSGPRINPSLGGGNSSKMYPSPGSVPTIRPHRPRTNSMVSVGSHFSGQFASGSGPAGGLSTGPTVSATIFLPDNSQTGLEKVIKSRLVETFLTVTIPPPSSATLSTHNPTPSSPPQPIQPSTKATVPPHNPRDKPQNLVPPAKSFDNNLGRNMNKLSAPSPPGKATVKSRRDSLSSTRLISSKVNLTHVRSASTTALRPHGKIIGTAPLLTPPVPVKNTPSEGSLPNWFSPTHHPSTNPTFPIDARSDYEYVDWTDLSGHMMKIEIWGKVSGEWQKEDTGQRKGKEKQIEFDAIPDDDWKLLDKWEVDLAKLVPLSDDLINDPSRLPSNTVVVTLSPPGGMFYLPSRLAFRAHSPNLTTGYTSDPESEVRKAKHSGNPLPGTADVLADPTHDTVLQSRRRRKARITDESNSPSDILKTAGWQDLFKLVTLQACILDNEGSLVDIVRGIDNILDRDVMPVLRREVSEREARVEELITNRRKVIEESERLKHEMEFRLENIRQRREMLTLAKKQHQEELGFSFHRKEEIIKYKTKHLTLRARFSPTRTTLLTILSAIFPIELLSPPDLLYTILDVPLPIPLTASDPGPPLTLLSHKDVTEDVVATSLGYAAQVVQLLAAYLGKGLVYPVTCVGSRSLIRDGISAMVGPRMFPLFSKGVDTYRFEYGVFLLNKDIEMLMADRDLHALDMRHTLPNLKNLLLTLTDGDGVHIQLSRPSISSPTSLLSNLEEVSIQPSSPLDPNSTTPKAASISNLPAEECPPSASASGSTTPTIIETSKKPRPFLAFSPLTDFIRGRYPSSSRASTKDAPELDDIQDAHDPSLSVPQGPREQDNEDENEDHRTIHDVILDEVVDIGNEIKGVPSLRNGTNSSVEPESSLEKLSNSENQSFLPAALSFSHRS
ncbi:hypothetical protein BDZ94DRAFT_1203773 [Collybia nuda]|uniref:Uncharacterized protein n=1 Tax=Collybia nuda TaxID=64659 RepID=A0A9P6C966_9AGAR|nr:hypothetical protein BDZ94DRAFT_1203773 [Collybia nuda]